MATQPFSYEVKELADNLERRLGAQSLERRLGAQRHIDDPARELVTRLRNGNTSQTVRMQAIAAIKSLMPPEELAAYEASQSEFVETFNRAAREVIQARPRQSPTMFPEEATALLRRAPNPTVVKVGPLYSYNSQIMEYPIVVSNQPEKVSEIFIANNPDLAQLGYNNLMVTGASGTSLRCEW